MATKQADFSIIGQSVPRLEGPLKVRGALKYAGDLSFPGLMVAKTLRCPHPHARVVKIDISSAKKLEGVVAVLTAADVPGNKRYGVATLDQPVLVAEGEKARCLGDPVALVGAESEDVAEEALSAIKTEYQELSPVTNPGEALTVDIPLVHEDRKSNLYYHYENSRGDVERAFSEAAVVVEATYFTPRQEHAYLEVEAAVAVPELDGGMTIYVGSQDPHYIRYAVGLALGIPASRVRVVALPAGGGFGGKYTVSTEIHAALLALKTGRPTKLGWSRSESMLYHAKRHPAEICMRLGATKEGIITALEASILSDGGAYASDSHGVIMVMGGYVLGAYNLPNFRVRADVVYTNNPPSGGMRGYGGPQGIMAIESAMDKLAAQLGLDPVEVRRRNVISQGLKPPRPLVVLDSKVTLLETMEAAIKAAGPRGKPSGPFKKTGRGLCSAMPGFEISALPLLRMKGTGAIVEMAPDGSVLIRSGVCEIGNGISTVLVQVAGEALGVSLDKVSISYGDTATTPKAGPTAASRSAYTSGNAVRLAALKVKETLLTKAAEKLEADPSMLEMSNDSIFVKELPERRLSLAEMASICYDLGLSLQEELWFTATHAGLGNTYASAVVDVEVDEETGEVEVIKLVNCHDVGRALNPEIVKGQIHGAAAQGLGWGLMEDMITQHGILLTQTFMDYLLPTALDLPNEMVPVMIEEPYPTGPFGAKGVAEHPLGLTATASASAICNATGKHVYQLPATPERVWRVLKGKGEKD